MSIVELMLAQASAEKQQNKFAIFCLAKKAVLPCASYVKLALCAKPFLRQSRAGSPVAV